MIGLKTEYNIADFKELYDRHSDEFYRIAISICGNTTEAEDVVQDAFVKIYKNISTLKDKSKLENWMRTILINTAKTAVKKWWRKTDSIEDNLTNIQLFHSDDYDESWKTMVGLLQLIPVGYRNVFVLHAMQDIPQHDVASILGVSLGTVKSQYFKAKKILRKKFEEAGLSHE